MLADAGRTNRPEMRKDFSRLPCDGFPVTGQPLPLVSKGGTSTLINCAYIGMILSVSRYTAHLEEQKAHDAQIQLQIATDAAANSEAQTAAEPTAQILNSDAKFEDESDKQ